MFRPSPCQRGEGYEEKGSGLFYLFTLKPDILVLNYGSMEYDKAAEILKALIEKHPLTPDEKEAVQTAMGLLILGNISKNHLKSRLKAQQAKKDKGLKW
jgi:hypothetical protein